jgi:hypothetical protein
VTAVVTTKGFDVVLVVHVFLAIASLVALLVLRNAAVAVVRGGELPLAAARSLTGRHELAARMVHLLPVSGVVLVALSRGSYHLTTGFVAVGLALWLVAASVLEAIGFPAQRAVAIALKSAGDPVPDARRLLRATETASLAIVVAAIVMLAGTF